MGVWVTTVRQRTTFGEAISSTKTVCVGIKYEEQSRKKWANGGEKEGGAAEGLRIGSDFKIRH